MRILFFRDYIFGNFFLFFFKKKTVQKAVWNVQRSFIFIQKDRHSIRYTCVVTALLLIFERRVDTLKIYIVKVNIKILITSNRWLMHFHARNILWTLPGVYKTTGVNRHLLTNWCNLTVHSKSIQCTLKRIICALKKHTIYNCRLLLLKF